MILITKSKDDDERIEHLAIPHSQIWHKELSTLAIIPMIPKIVEKEVANIMANFTVFVIQAMKNLRHLKIE